MGFEVPRRTVVFDFTGGDYEGAIVRCRLDVNLDTYLYYARVKFSPDSALDLIEAASRRFGEEILLDWNLEDNGEPIPATADGFVKIPPALNAIIIAKWLGEVMAVPDPLVGRSSNGGAPPGMVIPMVTLESQPD